MPHLLLLLSPYCSRSAGNVSGEQWNVEKCRLYSTGASSSSFSYYLLLLVDLRSPMPAVESLIILLKLREKMHMTVLYQTTKLLGSVSCLQVLMSNSITEGVIDYCVRWEEEEKMQVSRAWHEERSASLLPSNKVVWVRCSCRAEAA